MPQTYADAGVRIDEGDRFVRLIKRPVRTTFNKRVLGDIGGFGGLFDARFKGLKNPVLVSSVDGVGTKLRVAQLAGRHDTIGQDLVNHCVNDILTVGAQPLFFLDYFATGQLKAETAAEVVRGFVRACKENGCALIGGETAEMPGFYQGSDYDLAGTIVGVAEKKRLITGKKIRKGDVMIGLPSTGLHTNGYSLARSVLLKRYDVSHFVDDLGKTVGEALLEVHRSYLRPVNRLLAKFNIHGLSHITGGGIEGNTNRILPKGVRLKVDWNAWERPVIFRLIQRLGEIPEDDARRAFNLGIGMIVIVSRKNVDKILRYLRKRGEPTMVIGEIVGGRQP
ncbi:MAG: phosphoribosylformylglycinamidine cyclo-ligase [Ignavibacteria bacterium]|nr:phosphoribosylformylglycinamidine cyclo-ligase [Ignavibacteria bacterium]